MPNVEIIKVLVRFHKRFIGMGGFIDNLVFEFLLSKKLKFTIYKPLLCVTSVINGLLILLKRIYNAKTYVL